MQTLSGYMMKTFGAKVYKISLNGGMTCPNRDGTIGTRGCIFCSAGGSGEFAAPPDMGIKDQLQCARERVSAKYRGGKYIAYFQAYTNTYAPVEFLETLFLQAMQPDDIVGLSVATRPDCLGGDVLRLLEKLNRIKPVWVELGLQTVHESTAEYVRRGYPLRVYDQGVQDLQNVCSHIITHVIFGLPGETEDMMMDTVDHVSSSPSKGIKLQLLHILKGTDLEADYLAGKFETMSMQQYLHAIERALARMPEDMVIHRLTGDAPGTLLAAPKWSADKKRIMNATQTILTKYASR